MEQKYRQFVQVKNLKQQRRDRLNRLLRQQLELADQAIAGSALLF